LQAQQNGLQKKPGVQDLHAQAYGSGVSPGRTNPSSFQSPKTGIEQHKSTLAAESHSDMAQLVLRQLLVSSSWA